MDQPPRGCDDVEESGDIFKDGQDKINRDIQANEFQYLASPEKGFWKAIDQTNIGDTNMSWISSFFTVIFEAFHSNSLWKQVMALGEGILRAVLGGLGADLQSIAGQAVAAAEAKGGAGTDKFAFAFDYIVKAFKDKTFDKTIINHSIENAVLALKAQNPNAVWVTDIVTLGATT